MSHAVFFDRDGIVNERRVDDYVTTWSEFHFLPGIFVALPRVKAAGFLPILVTNQRGVALGRMTLNEVDRLHMRMQDELRERCGVQFAAIYVCPHSNEDACDCRKPKPGMLTRAIAEHALDAAHSWMIGDSERDVVAGNRAGCRSILVTDTSAESEATICCASLVDAVDQIVLNSASGDSR